MSTGSTPQQLRAKAAAYRRQVDMFGDEQTRKALEREAYLLERRASELEKASTAAGRDKE